MTLLVSFVRSFWKKFFCICIWNGKKSRISILTWLLRHIFGYFMATNNTFVTAKEKSGANFKEPFKSIHLLCSYYSLWYFFFPNRKWLPNIRKLSQGRTSEKSSDATAKNLPVNRESSKPNFKVRIFIKWYMLYRSPK